MAFGVRAGCAAVRNRAKRQAREAFRDRQHKLPDKMAIVIATRGKIASLTRRQLREELEELFDRASRLRSSFRPDGISK